MLSWWQGLRKLRRKIHRGLVTVIWAVVWYAGNVPEVEKWVQDRWCQPWAASSPAVAQSGFSSVENAPCKQQWQFCNQVLLWGRNKKCNLQTTLPVLLPGLLWGFFSFFKSNLQTTLTVSSLQYQVLCENKCTEQKYK